ncbi:MAG: cation transporter [Deltaproteobacteria bacterium]|nr:cation transporter [Deltaproteobacteria bacterium]
MKQTSFHIEGMDCSSEEQMIRMHLEGVEGVSGLEFDLAQRRLEVFHNGSPGAIADALEPLDLGARQLDHRQDVDAPPQADDASNRGPLMWALAINAALFVGELVAGLLAGSMGLVADSLDMMADAFVYALSLAAIGRNLTRKRRLAAGSAYLQGGLALLGLAEVVRRFLTPTGEPEVLPMVVVSLVALAANVVTLLVLRRTTRGEAHIEASWIFTSNDIKVNALVILAGLLVWWTSSQVPDLIAGGLIFLVVASGARRILVLAHGSFAKRD